jgi:putative ABC transport system permease protein
VTSPWLVLRFAFRSKTRFVMSCVGVGVTLVAFLVLRTVVDCYAVTDAGIRTDRMEVRHKNSIVFPLYTAMAGKLSHLPGVRDVSWMCWFVGTYMDERRNFTQVAVEAESYLRLYPEYRPTDAQRAAWLADPTGAIVGDRLAKKHGWKLGDKINIEGTIYPGHWTFTLRGVYSGEGDQVDRERLLFHWKYLNDKLMGESRVQRLIVLVDEPRVGKEIDAFFANSGTPTKTESELQLRRQWASWSAGMVDVMSKASFVMLFVLALVLANSMAMSARDSNREFAVMRAIGWRARHVRALILGEALVIGLMGSVVALVAAPGVLRGVTDLLLSQLGGTWSLRLDAWLAGATVLTGVSVSLLSCSLPALRASRVRLVDALRRTV